MTIGAHAQVPEDCRQLLCVEGVTPCQLQNLTSVLFCIFFSYNGQPVSQKDVEILIRNPIQAHQGAEMKKRRFDVLENGRHHAFFAAQEQIVDIFVQLHDGTKQFVRTGF